MAQQNEQSSGLRSKNALSLKPLKALALNPQRILIAREAMGLSQKDLAKAADVTQPYISKLEDGLPVNVGAEVIQKMADALDVLPEYLVESSTPQVPKPHYRKRKSVSRGYIRGVEGRLALTAEAIATLNRKIEWEFLGVPEIDPHDVGGAHNVAEIIRRRFNLPCGPIYNLFELIEAAGVYIVPFDFESQWVDGVSMWLDPVTPVIFYNKDFTSARIRLSVAHELGHLIMHKLNVGDVTEDEREDEAFAFAISFLVPSDDVCSELFPLNLDRLARLKLKWRVSMQALLRYARDLDAIKESYYRYLCMAINRAGYRTAEPYEELIPKEEPKMFRELIDVYRDELGYSLEAMSKTVRWTRGRFKKTFLPEEEIFRVL